MRTTYHNLQLFLFFFLVFTHIIFAQPIIVDHNCTNINSIPESDINQAKNSLHIGYGHTSHGSQLITGMDNLDVFMGGNNLYIWHDGSQEGYLDLDDNFASGDLGHNGNISWATKTRTYLDNGANAAVNVIIWSWCGGVSNNTEAGIQAYLDEMNQLETEYPNVKFVYMTGHSDGSSESGNLHIRNQQIRNYCITNNKILYDFYDIECYNPDDSYYGDKSVNDNCDYDTDENGSRDGNWATEWQNSHTENVDWYSCSSAHSQPLNANRKAYAAWWLWARLGGWDGNPLPVELTTFTATIFNGKVILNWETATEINNYSFEVERQYQGPSIKNQDWVKIGFVKGHGNSNSPKKYYFTDNTIPQVGKYSYRLKQTDIDGSFEYSNIIEMTISVPLKFKLNQNYPNPFNPATNISFILPNDSNVRLTILNVLGQEIFELINGNKKAGFHNYTYDASSLSSGIYYYRITTNNHTETKQMILIK